MNHNPSAPSFIKTMERYEVTLRKFIDSDEFKSVIINHLCHTRKWHYENQTLKVELLPGGTWTAPSGHSWSEHGECIVTLDQASYHFKRMEAIGETRDFEDILARSPEEARAVADRLYTDQESSIKEVALRHFHWMRERGSLD